MIIFITVARNHLPYLDFEKRHMYNPITTNSFFYFQQNFIIAFLNFVLNFVIENLAIKIVYNIISYVIIFYSAFRLFTPEEDVNQLKKNVLAIDVTYLVF